MKNHIYFFDRAVVGGNLNAFIYAYTNNLPLIINSLSSPYFFQEKEKTLWNKIYFLLSISGLNMFGDKVDRIRLDDNAISVATKDFKVIKIQFNELILFDDDSLEGLPLAKKKKDKFIVLDWMTASPCAKHQHEHFSTNDNFVKDVYFYPTERMFGNHLDIKDLVTVSYLNSKQLQNFDYSDTYARFKTEKILKQNDITGRKNGFLNGKQVHYSLKLKVEKRDIRKMEMDLYEDTNNLKFKYSSQIEANSLFPSYAVKLNKIFDTL